MQKNNSSKVQIATMRLSLLMTTWILLSTHPSVALNTFSINSQQTRQSISASASSSADSNDGVPYDSSLQVIPDTSNQKNHFGQYDQETLLRKFISQGAPLAATKRALEFMRLNLGKTVSLLSDKKYVTRRISNDRYLVVIDFTMPSTEKRLFFLNLKTGELVKTYVAHGEGSGMNEAVRFSNIPDSRMSSLGFYLTDSTYIGSHGRSIYLLGMENSNDKARQRMIVIHPADYVSESFIKQYHRLGRSWGCPAVSNQFMPILLKNMESSAVVYAHHDRFMQEAQQHGDYQGTSLDEINNISLNPNRNKILPGEESCIQNPYLKECSAQ